MSTLGDILLLLNTYRESKDNSAHIVSVAMDPATNQILKTVSAKLDQHSEYKIPTSRLIRVLLKFSIEALNLDQVAASAEPLPFIPPESATRKAIENMRELADIINLDAKILTDINDIPEGDVIWKSK